MSPEDQARLMVDVGYASIGPALSCCVKCVECDVGEEASRRCRIRWQPPIRKVARAKALRRLNPIESEQLRLSKI